MRKKILNVYKHSPPQTPPQTPPHSPPQTPPHSPPRSQHNLPPHSPPQTPPTRTHSSDDESSEHNFPLFHKNPIQSRFRVKRNSDTKLTYSIDDTSVTSLNPSKQPSAIRVIKEKHDLDLLEREQKLREEYFINSNGWNENIEQNLKKIGDKAEGWRWMHKMAATKYNKYYHLWGIINIVFTGILGFGQIPNILNCQNDLNALKWLVFTLQFIVGTSLVAEHFLDYGERKKSHKTAESGFAALFYNISVQLNLDRKSRQFGEDYSEFIHKEYTDLSSNPDIPPIPYSVYKAYLKKIHGSSIANIDELDQIQIYKDPPGIIFSSVTPQTADDTIDLLQGSPPENPPNDTALTITIPRANKKISSLDNWHLKRFYNNK